MVECCIAAWPILAACHASQNRRVERGLNARADTGFLTMDEARARWRSILQSCRSCSNRTGMQNDAPSRGGGVTEPNEFDEFRRRVAHEERRRRILVTVLDVLTALALLAIAGPRPQDDFLLAPVSPSGRS